MTHTNPSPVLQKAPFDPWFEWAEKSLDEAEKWFDLNVGACHGTLQDMARSCRSACDVRDMPGALHWHSVALKPFAERSAEYGAQLMGLLAGSGRELGRAFENPWPGMAWQMPGGLGEKSRPAHEWPQAAFDDLRRSMQAFDAIWAPARQQLMQSRQNGWTQPARVGKARPRAA